MTPEERLKVLEEVYQALVKCPIYALKDGGGLGMKREDVSKALASLNNGVIPMPHSNIKIVFDKDDV